MPYILKKKQTRKKYSKLGGWSSVSNIAEELWADICERLLNSVNKQTKKISGKSNNKSNNSEKQKAFSSF